MVIPRSLIISLMNEPFVAYLNSDDVHDATVLRVTESAGALDVVIKTVEGKLVAFEFREVRSVKQHHPEGMLLYSLSETRVEPPYRKFSFTNSDEEDKAELEVVAKRFERRNMTS